MEISVNYGNRIEVKKEKVEFAGKYLVWKINSFLPAELPAKIILDGKLFEYDFQSEIHGPDGYQNLAVYYRCYEYILRVDIDVIG